MGLWVVWCSMLFWIVDWKAGILYFLWTQSGHKYCYNKSIIYNILHFESVISTIYFTLYFYYLLYTIITLINKIIICLWQGCILLWATWVCNHKVANFWYAVCDLPRGVNGAWSRHISDHFILSGKLPVFYLNGNLYFANLRLTIFAL